MPASPRLFRAILMTAGSSNVFMFSMTFILNLFLREGAFFRASLMNMGTPLIDSYLMGIIQPGRRGPTSAISVIVCRLPSSLSTIPEVTYLRPDTIQGTTSCPRSVVGGGGLLRGWNRTPPRQLQKRED